MPDSAARLRFDKFKFGEFDEELGLESAVGIGAAGDAFTWIGEFTLKFSESDLGVILKFVEVAAEESVVGGAGASLGCWQGGPFSGAP